MSAYECVGDWDVGNDPGMSSWRVTGASGVVLQVADVTGWTMSAYDLTADPTAVIATLSGDANTENFATYNNLQLSDGYWGKDDIGYNLRHYLRASDFDPPLKALHQYKFVYLIETPEFDATPDPGWGVITLVRRGTCLSRGG